MLERRNWVLGGLLILGGLTLPAIARLPWSDQIAQAYPYGGYSWGQGGRDGRDGRDGRNGASGTSQTVFVDGSPVNLDLSGGNGENGANADHGESATCPVYWDEPDYNIQGANGGRGGQGGKAGSGGNGGDLTIFYKQPQALRNVFVNTLGGQSGASGRGGYGGDGCGCLYASWKVETCKWEDVKPTTPEEKPHKEQKCTTERYYCTSGSDGSNGQDGGTARDGTNGSVTLIRNIEAIPTENTSSQISLDALQKSGVTLSKNIWRSQSGLLNKLGSGSKVPDTYTEYVELWRSPIRATWKATQPNYQFSQAKFFLGLRDDKSLNVIQNDEAWLEYHVDRSGNGFNIVVTRAMQGDDATQLIRQSVTGSGRDLKVVLTDFGKHQDWLNTQFRVIYRTRNPNPEFREGYTYGDRYNQVLPAEYVTKNGAEYTLHLGDLPINSQYFQSGTGLELEITAERSFANRSSNQTIRWQGLLP